MKHALTGLVVVVSSLVAGCGGGNGDGGGDDPGPGQPTGTQFFVEDFLDTANEDGAASDGDWGGGEASVLRGQPVTSRNAYVYSYPETDSGSNSGRGQYVPLIDLLVGTDQGALPPPLPATNLGRRMLISISDTEIGAAGTVTGVGWGPALNQTFAASYPNLRLRMGYLDQTLPVPLQLSSSISGSYAGTPTLIYDGPYQVPQSVVANVPGEPTSSHVGSYPQNPGCTTVGAGWNSQLFTFTGFYPFPAPTTLFNWDPGDPQVDDDSVLLLDISAQEGDFTQALRGWFAVTFPCSGILIGGYPEQRLSTTYEADVPNPADNFVAGVVNPAPLLVDICFTFSRRKSVGQSKFFAGAYGDDTDYELPVILPSTQANGASLIVEFQGADAVEADGVTINQALPFTGWVTDIHQCDGMQNLRYRICLISGLDTLLVARVDRITIGMSDLNP